MTVKKLEKFLSKGENKSLFFNTIFDYYHYKLLSELCSSLREVRLSKLLEENAAIKTVQNDFYPPPFLAFCFPKLQFSTLNQLWGSVMDYQLFFSIVRKSQNYYLILIIWECVLVVLLLPYISVSVKFAWKSIITDPPFSVFARVSNTWRQFGFYYYLRTNLQRRIQRHDYWLFRIFDQSVCK